MLYKKFFSINVFVIFILPYHLEHLEGPEKNNNNNNKSHFLSQT